MADVATLVVKVVSQVTDATKGLDNVTDSAGKMRKGLSTAAKVGAAALLGITAAAVSWGNAAAEDAQSQAILANALKNNAGATDAAIAKTEDWIAAQAAATGVADDQLRPALGNLVRATGDVATSQDALKVAMDVAAATGKDVESVSAAIAKGYGGQTTALGKLVPGLDKATLASGDMTAVMDELKDKTGGAAADAAGTAAGQMAIMQNSIDEAKESIGAGLLPVLGSMAELLTTVGNFAQDHATTIQVLAVVIAGLAAAVILVNAAVAAWSAITAVATAAQWLWNAALAANPIGLIVIAIIALIAVIVILWNKSDGFRDAVLAGWDAIKSAATAVGGAIKAAWLAVWDAIKTAAGAVRDFVVAAWDAVKSAASTVVSAIQTAWTVMFNAIKGVAQTYLSAVTAVWDAIKSAANKVVGIVEDTWAGLWSSLKSAVSGLGDVLSAPFDAMRDAIQWVIDKVNALIGALGRIHVPKVDLPGPFSLGGSSTTTTTTRAAAPGVPMVGARASSASGGVTINVTGAIDPEATARQIRRILDGHNRRVGLAAS